MKERSALERLRELEGKKHDSLGAQAGAHGVPSRGQKGALGGALAVLILVLLKGKGLLLFFLTKLKFLWVFLKLGKFATTGWTMLLMVWTYAMFYGLPFAALLVLLILVHELGHGVAARSLGLRVGAPVFIPFFGAFIALKEQPRSTYDDFQIGAGGPIAGSAGALVCVVLSQTLSGRASGLFAAVGYVALLINLFNLMPVWQLDGQRMLGPLRLREGLPSLALLAMVLVVAARGAHHLHPVALIVVLVAGYRFGSLWWRARRPPPTSALERLGQIEKAQKAIPDTVTSSERIRAALTYVTLASLLIVLVHFLPALLPIVR